MKLCFVIIHIILVGSSVWASLQYEGLADNEFAEFEEFEAEEDDMTEFTKGKSDKSQERIIQDEFQVEEDIEDEVIVEVIIYNLQCFLVHKVFFMIN